MNLCEFDAIAHVGKLDRNDLTDSENDKVAEFDVSVQNFALVEPLHGFHYHVQNLFNDQLSHSALLALDLLVLREAAKGRIPRHEIVCLRILEPLEELEHVWDLASTDLVHVPDLFLVGALVPECGQLNLLDLLYYYFLFREFVFVDAYGAQQPHRQLRDLCVLEQAIF